MSTSNCGGKSEVNKALTKHLLRERAASVDAWDHKQVEIAIKGGASGLCLNGHFRVQRTQLNRTSKVSVKTAAHCSD